MKKKWIIIVAVCIGLIIAIALLTPLQPDISKPTQEIIITAQYLVSNPVPTPPFIMSLKPSPSIKLVNSDAICVTFSVGYLLNPGENIDELIQFLPEHTQLFVNGQKVLDGRRMPNTLVAYPPVLGRLPNGRPTGDMDVCAVALRLARGVNLAEVHTEDMLDTKHYYAWAFTVS